MKIFPLLGALVFFSSSCKLSSGTTNLGAYDHGDSGTSSGLVKDTAIEMEWTDVSLGHFAAPSTTSIFKKKFDVYLKALICPVAVSETGKIYIASHTCADVLEKKYTYSKGSAREFPRVKFSIDEPMLDRALENSPILKNLNANSLLYLLFNVESPENKGGLFNRRTVRSLVASAYSPFFKFEPGATINLTGLGSSTLTVKKVIEPKGNRPDNYDEVIAANKKTSPKERVAEALRQYRKEHAPKESNWWKNFKLDMDFAFSWKHRKEINTQRQSNKPTSRSKGSSYEHRPSDYKPGRNVGVEISDHTTVYNDASHSTRVGRFTFNSDGTHSVDYGNTRFNSNGSQSTIFGNMEVHEDGTFTTHGKNMRIEKDGSFSYTFRKPEPSK